MCCWGGLLDLKNEKYVVSLSFIQAGLSCSLILPLSLSWSTFPQGTDSGCSACGPSISYLTKNRTVTPAKNLMLKELSEVVCNIESIKDKRSEADPNLERTMTLCQDTEKMFTQCSKLYDKKTATVPTPLTKFFTKRCNTLSMFLMF